MAALHLVKSIHESAENLVCRYCEYCDMRRLPWMHQAFSQLLEEGFAAQLLEEIILKTAQAPRPSWAYLQAIIRNCRSSGVYVLADFSNQKPRKKHYYYEQDY